MGVKIHACVGGTSVREDIKLLKQGVNVVVGTPGRIHDMMKKGYFKTENIKLLVIDEADELVSKDYLP